MSITWEEIDQKYVEYRDRSVEGGLIRSESDLPPLQTAVQGKPGGAVVLGGDTPLEREHLLTHNSSLPDIDELDPDMLLRIPLSMAESLKVNLSDDHRTYWIHTVETLHSQAAATFHIDTIDQLEWLIALMSAPLANIEGRHAKWSDGWCAQEVLENGNTLASYLAYPVLESVIKSICDDDFYPDGTIKSGRTVSILPPGNSRTGDSEKEVSSLGDLLWHVEDQVADGDLPELMVEMRKRIADFYGWPEDEVYGSDGLGGLRNSMAHGEDQAKAEYGVIMNYISLLAWGVLTDSVSTE